MSKVLSLIFLCLVFHSTVQANTCDSVGSFAWILGSWSSESSELKVSESWKQISNKTFEGSGLTYSIEKNEIVSSETLRLV